MKIHECWPEIVTAWAAWVVDPANNPPVQHKTGCSRNAWHDWESFTFIDFEKSFNMQWRVKPKTQYVRVYETADMAKILHYRVVTWNGEGIAPIPDITGEWRYVTDWAEMKEDI